MSASALVASGALAAPASKTSRYAPPPSDVRIGIPRTQIAIENEEFEAIERPATPSRGEAWFSNYVPHEFRLPSRVMNATAFSRTELPQFGVAFITRALGDGEPASSVSLRFAVSAMRLQREVEREHQGANQRFEQRAYLMPFEFGPVFASSQLKWWIAQPFLETVAVPTFVLTSRSVMDNGESYASLGYRVGVGVTADIPLTRVALVARGDRMGGSIQGSSLNGFGLTFGLRAALE